MDKDVEVLDELVIQLRKPVKLGEEIITELRLREPNMGEIEKFTKNRSKWSPLEAMNFFIADIAKISKPAVDLIGGRDGKLAREYLQNFL